MLINTLSKPYFHRFIFILGAIIFILAVYTNMEKELQRKTLDRFFRNEYDKLLSYTRKNSEERYTDASPEDIIQDVMVGLIDRMDLDVQIGNLTGYIYQSLRNRILDFRRRKQRNVSIEKLGDTKNGNNLAELIAEDQTGEEKEYLQIDPERLREAIEMLRPDEQALIVATEFEDQTYEELSEEWEVPVGTLLSRKHRALAKLYKLLSNQQK